MIHTSISRNVCHIEPTTTAALIGLGGSALGGLFGRSSASKSIRFLKQAAKMAHQWEVADLRAAGLNPILSGTGGPGAKQAGGAMPSTPDFAGSAIMAARVKAEIENINSLTDLNKAKKGVIDPISVIGGTVGTGLGSAKAMIAEMFTRQKQRERQERAKKGVRAYKLKQPFKQKSTPLYTRGTYGK